ncbi:MAG TPA: TonB family protein [Vicinamibacteria bacterium]|nr:TonB family protein [Vicinamibacteria bacterium]
MATAIALGVWFDPVASAQESRRVVRASAPEYPELMYLSGIEGKFVVAATVSASGEVSDVDVLESPGAFFNPEVAAHVERWRFEPNDNETVLSVEFVFRLLPRQAPVQERGVFFVAPTTIEICMRKQPPVIRYSATGTRE